MRTTAVLVAELLLSSTFILVASEISSDAVCWTLDGALSPQDFKRASCALCYLHIVRQWRNPKPFVLPRYDNINHTVIFINHSYVADAGDESSALYKSFRWEYTRNQWKECCHQAEQCCTKMAETNHDESEDCPPTWTVHHCWPSLKKGQRQDADCPAYGYAFFPEPPCKRYSRLSCFENGTVRDDSRCESLEFHRRPPEDRSPEVTEPQSTERCCRTSRQYELSLEAYRLDTCARCYSYLPRLYKTKMLVYDEELGVLWDTVNKTIVEAHPDSEIIENNLYDNDTLVKWRDCCRAALDCCETMASKPEYPSDGPYCPRTWDSWQCFDDTPPGVLAYGDCPDYIYFSGKAVPRCRGQAERYCQADGEWEKKFDEYKRVWEEKTNYLSCSNQKAVKSKQFFLFGCYVVSFLALIPSMVIFWSYRQLNVIRVQMHRNFFLALSLNCICVVSYNSIILLPEGSSGTPIEGNGVGCKLLLVLNRYIRMCTYTWMLCEGFYLHKMITSSFAEQKKMIWFYLFGWVFPLLPITVFSVLMYLNFDNRCWAYPTIYEWVLGSVNLSCILLNFIFLFNVIRVLLSKLRSQQSNEPHNYRKAVRSTLLLIPLFGTHFVLASYHGDGTTVGCTAMLVYSYFKNAVEGLQGFCVALVFCYTNGEVIYLLKRSLERYKIRRGLQPNTTRTRWSMSTQVSNALDPNAIHKVRGHSPNGKVHSNGDVTPASTPKMSNGDAKKRPGTVTSPSYESRGFGFDNVELSKDKVTEL